MLAKLIKYNLKPIFKSILPFIILLLAVVILFNVTAYDVTYIHDPITHLPIDEIKPPEIQQFLHGLSYLMFYCTLILLVATAVRSIWHRFKTNFYSDQAYLTHTLPISRNTLWNAQICTILIIFISILIVLILNFLLLVLTRNGQQLLESFGLLGGCSNCVGDYYYIEPYHISVYLSYAFVVLIEFIFLALCGMTGIILSNRLGKNLSILIGAGLYLLGGFILLSSFQILGKINPDITTALFDTPAIGSPQTGDYLQTIALILCYIGTIYLCYSIATYFVDRKLIQRGINLD